MAANESICEDLHQLCWKMERYCFPINFKISFKTLPKNGGYVMFERGETGHGGERIVRVGSHTGDNNLKSRLRQHYADQGTSIFRKHIGRAIIGKDGDDDFLKKWNIRMSQKKNKEKYPELIGHPKILEIDKQVSSHLRENLSFVVFDELDKSDRLALERCLIGTVVLCNQCRPSEQWLGCYSYSQEITECGLWNIQHVNHKPREIDQLQFLQKNRDNTAGHACEDGE